MQYSKHFLHTIIILNFFKKIKSSTEILLYKMYFKIMREIFVLLIMESKSKTS